MTEAAASGDLASLHEGPSHRVDAPPGAVAVVDPPRQEAWLTGRRVDLLHRLPNEGRVRRIGQVAQTRLKDLARREARDPFHRRRRVAERAVEVEHQDGVGGALDEAHRPEVIRST